MGGGLMQLVAYGAEDIYLTGQPQITYFKAVYRRHTNFSIESIEQSVYGSIGFGNSISLVVTRNADLLKKLWIQYSPFNMLSGASDGTAVGANIGHSIINYVDFLIGGQLIDRQYGKWMTIWNYLTDSNIDGSQGPLDDNCYGPGEQPPNLGGDSDKNTFLPRPTIYNRMSYTHKGNSNIKTSSGAPLYAYVPLEFWFCRNPGLAIPLIALQYHEVRINIQLGDYSGICNGTQTGTEFLGFSVYADYIYLDTTERRQFAQNAHEYLIEQVQINSNITNAVERINFIHPVKELIWAPVPNLVVSRTSVSGPSSPSSSFFKATPTQPNNYKLILNGTDRFTERDITYFTRNQVWDCHSGFGSVMFPDSIAVYSFALKPEEHQPSGTCNFSRIDTAYLSRTNTYPVDVIDLYALNYNVLRIVSGMGGLAYSN
jgi:hypothetical protein